MKTENSENSENGKSEIPKTKFSKKIYLDFEKMKKFKILKSKKQKAKN